MYGHLSGKKILLTGASGFLGRHLLAKLGACDVQLTAFSRSAIDAKKLPPQTQIIKGDCLDETDMRNALKGQDIVIHLAGLLFGSAWQDYLAVNGRAAQILGRIAAQENISRVVFISSLAAAGPCGKTPGRNEQQPASPVSAYGWSKLLAETTLSARLGQKLVVVRPPIIYGSGDKGLLPLFKSCAKGFGIAPKNFPVSLIHADDCANAILLACGPKAEGVYHLNDGREYSMSQICQAMAMAQGGGKPFMISPPKALMASSALVSAGVFQLWAPLAKKLGKPMRPPAWNWDKYRESQQEGWLADGRKIVKELGFKPLISLENGMAETVDGYRREGWL